MTQLELEHYVAKYKEHEANRTSTNERNEYWKQYAQRKNHTPRTVARWEHG